MKGISKVFNQTNFYGCRNVYKAKTIFRRIVLVIASLFISLLLGAWNDLHRDDRILLTVLMIVAVILWDIVPAKLYKNAPILEMVLFYGSIFTICSFFVPVIDITIMIIAAIIYELLKKSDAG